MKAQRAVLALALVLAGCGGGDGGSGGPVVIGGTATPTPSASTGTCGLQTRQDWAFAQLKEWYLFPETLPPALNPAPYATLNDYIDALTAGARGQRRDRYFTYATSIAEENAYYQSGATAGYGFRLSFNSSPVRLFVTESFEGAPAFNAAIDRGTEILAIGTGSTMQSISSLYASNGTQAVANALGPDTVGTTRTFRLRSGGVERVVTLAKANFDIQPVSPRYGARILTDGGRKIGYLNLRTFISSAEPAMRQAFADFKAQGVTEMVVDLRYNGGGLVSVSRTKANLLGGNRSSADLFTRLSFRPEKAAAENEPYYFSAEANAIAPTKIAFIGFGDTASASEGVINGLLPYLGANAALIGSNTYGKPVGQIAIDKAECDDRLRIVAFAVENRDGNSNYYNGLAGSMQATCQATDDLDHVLGDPAEASIGRALDYLAGRSCTPISTATASARSSGITIAAENKTPTQQLLTPERATVPQRDVPGLF